MNNPTENPYTTPRSQLDGGPPHRPISGVVYGLVVDLGGTLIWSFLIFIAMAASGLNQNQMQDLMAARFPPSAFFIAAAMGGLFMSYLGGYVCARYARRNEYRFGTIFLVLTFAAGSLLSSEAPMTTVRAFLYGVNVVVIYWGVSVGVARNARDVAARRRGHDAGG